MNHIEQLLLHKRSSIESAKLNAGLEVPDDDRRLFWSTGTFKIIAEIKRASLSAGSIRSAVAIPSLARSYAAAGASAISVLTEEKYFHGSLDDLRLAKESVKIPLLQKDFVLDPFQIEEAKSAGADFVLLIARFLEKHELTQMLDLCCQLKLNAIVEVTTEKDLLKIQREVKYVGVNSRDLETLRIDTANFARLRPHLPDSFLIAESGISNLETLNQVIDLNYHGALIGEHFLRCPDPALELEKFVHFARTKTLSARRLSRPRVKICGITNEADAFFAIDSGADALGFIFAESPRQIKDEALASFRDRIPATVLSVGVFKGQSSKEVQSVIRKFDLDVAQIYEPVDIGVPSWCAKVVTKIEDFNDQQAGECSPVLWDIKAERGKLLEYWNEAAKSSVFALAGGLHPGNVSQAIAICRPQWVDVASSVERLPGKKDSAKIKAFFKELPS